MSMLSGLSTNYGFATAIALIASHKFKPPRWLFTRVIWNPKPMELKQQMDRDKEVTQEDIIEVEPLEE